MLCWTVDALITALVGPQQAVNVKLIDTGKLKPLHGMEILWKLTERKSNFHSFVQFHGMELFSVVWKHPSNKSGSILWKSSSLFQISDAR